MDAPKLTKAQFALLLEMVTEGCIAGWLARSEMSIASPLGRLGLAVRTDALPNCWEPTAAGREAVLVRAYAEAAEAIMKRRSRDPSSLAARSASGRKEKGCREDLGIGQRDEGGCRDA